MPESPGSGRALPPLTDQRSAGRGDIAACIATTRPARTPARPTSTFRASSRRSRTGNLKGSARTILESNLLGATCARVCPVQELCEGACVLGSEHKPIMIGRLQRYAMDYVYDTAIDVIQRRPRPLATASR